MDTFSLIDYKCTNIDPITLLDTSKVSRDRIVKLSDGKCYIRSSLLIYINMKLPLYGTEDFLLPLRTPITDEDMDAVYGPLDIDWKTMVAPESDDAVLINNGDLSDDFGALSEYSVARNSMFNPGGIYSIYNADGSLRVEDDDDEEMDVEDSDDDEEVSDVVMNFVNDLFYYVLSADEQNEDTERGIETAVQGIKMSGGLRPIMFDVLSEEEEERVREVYTSYASRDFDYGFRSDKGEIKLVSIKKSPKKDKKWVATFINKDTGREKQTHFGAVGYEDYTMHKDDKRKKNYISRHSSEDWSDPTKAGTLSRYVLWNKKNFNASVRDYKNKFNL